MIHISLFKLHYIFHSDSYFTIQTSLHFSWFIFHYSNFITFLIPHIGHGSYFTIQTSTFLIPHISWFIFHYSNFYISHMFIFHDSNVHDISHSTISFQFTFQYSNFITFFYTTLFRSSYFTIQT